MTCQHPCGFNYNFYFEVCSFLPTTQLRTALYTELHRLVSLSFSVWGGEVERRRLIFSFFLSYVGSNGEYHLSCTLDFICLFKCLSVKMKCTLIGWHSKRLCIYESNYAFLKVILNINSFRRILMKTAIVCLSTWWKKGKQDSQGWFCLQCSYPNLLHQTVHFLSRCLLRHEITLGAAPASGRRDMWVINAVQFTWDVTEAGCSNSTRSSSNTETMASARVTTLKDEAGPRPPSRLRCPSAHACSWILTLHARRQPHPGQRHRQQSQGSYQRLSLDCLVDYGFGPLSKGWLPPVPENQGTRVLQTEGGGSM